jgi:hypothetical protein
MAGKPGKDVRRRKGRSAAQREWNAAVGLASKAWEALSDEQGRAWNVEGKSRRTSGQRYFTGINARRIRDGQEPLTGPPERAAYGGKPIIRRLVIRNRGDRIALELGVFQVPSVRVTVWGSRPCNRGVSVGAKCPRLGDLPAPAGGVSDITGLYFRKHGKYIEKHGAQLVGKRIFIRTRVELEGWSKLYEGTNAVVPAPEGRGGAAKRG